MDLEEPSPLSDGWILVRTAELDGADGGDQREREESLLPATLNIVLARYSERLGPRKQERGEERQQAAQRKKGLPQEF